MTSTPPRLHQAVGPARRRARRVPTCWPIRFASPRRPASAPGRIPTSTSASSTRGSSIRQDNTATFFVGKTDLGQGTGTAFRQIMADELDIAYDQTSCVMGSTDVTVDQGGSGGSDALQTDGWPMRRVAAEARRVLLDMASTRLGVPVGAARGQRRRRLGGGGSVEARDLRRARSAASASTSR